MVEIEAVGRKKKKADGKNACLHSVWQAMTKEGRLGATLFC